MPQSSLPSPTLSPGNYVKISFEDQGTGIKDQDLPNIFDPYFTTKPGASGLGLATAHSIIQQHQGHISVHSEIGKGTTFTVYLPSSYSTVNIDPQVIPKGRGRILVMDDEQSICRMVEDALTQFGYEVTVAQDGQAAIDLFSEALTSGGNFDAILLDLTIPGGMGGKEAIQHLRKVRSARESHCDQRIFRRPDHVGFPSIWLSRHLSETLQNYRSCQDARILVFFTK